MLAHIQSMHLSVRELHLLAWHSLTVYLPALLHMKTGAESQKALGSMFALFFLRQMARFAYVNGRLLRAYVGVCVEQRSANWHTLYPQRATNSGEMENRSAVEAHAHYNALRKNMWKKHSESSSVAAYRCTCLAFQWNGAFDLMARSATNDWWCWNRLIVLIMANRLCRNTLSVVVGVRRVAVRQPQVRKMKAKPMVIQGNVCACAERKSSTEFLFKNFNNFCDVRR